MNPTDPAAIYIFEFVSAWASDPDRFDHHAETPGDVRNLLIDLAGEIEQGSYLHP